MKLPGTFAVASNCVALRAVPVAIGAGVAQVILGGLINGELHRGCSCGIGFCVGRSEDRRKRLRSHFQHRAGSWCVSERSRHVGRGVQLRTAQCGAVAIAAGVLQLIAGVLLLPAAVMVTCVDPFRVIGVAVADDGDDPAGVASM